MRILWITQNPRARVLESYERVKKVGFEGNLKEERERAVVGTLLNDIREYWKNRMGPRWRALQS